jgi:prophage tail gpP-like protein
MVGQPTEQATLIVNGMEFKDWETVMVRQAKLEHPAYRFRFTCSEAVPIASNLTVLQIKPGDECKVLLAGQLAVSGKVYSRQVYYDKRRHYVEIQGASRTLDLSAASPITKTMEHKDINMVQLAKGVLQPYNIPLVTKGQIPDTKFPRVSFMHGLSSFDHLDIYARSIGCAFTSDPQGSFVLLGKGSTESGGANFKEGRDILIGREIIYNTALSTGTPLVAQSTGNDQKSMTKVASVPYYQEQMKYLGAANNLPYTIPMELPLIDQGHMQGRTDNEINMMLEDQVTVFVTVYGWLEGGQLYKPDKNYTVDSPMLMMHGSEALKSKSVTFTQDNNEGTRTTLELCNDLAMSGVPAESQIK